MCMTQHDTTCMTVYDTFWLAKAPFFGSKSNRFKLVPLPGSRAMNSLATAMDW